MAAPVRSNRPAAVVDTETGEIVDIASFRGQQRDVLRRGRYVWYHRGKGRGTSKVSRTVLLIWLAALVVGLGVVVLTLPR